jgi:hypothetical protein
MNEKKVGKAQIILLLYEKLLVERRISNTLSVGGESLPSVTFKRYIYDIRDYLAAFSSDYEILYSRRGKAYKLVKKHPLGEKEALLSIGAPQNGTHS